MLPLHIFYKKIMMKRYILLLLLSLLQISLYATSKHLSADSLVAIGYNYYKEERYMDALEVLGKAMDFADRTNNEKAFMEALSIIGNTYMLFEDYDQALRYYIICLEKAQTNRSYFMASKLKCNMLQCYAMLGKQKEAEDCYKSIGTLHMGDTNTNRFYTYLNQAMLSMARKYYKGAVFFHTQAMKYAIAHGMPRVYAAAEMGQIGSMYEENGDMEQAEKWYLKCKDYAEKGHCAGPLTSACERLASLYRKQGKNDLSVQYNKLFVQYSDSFFQQKEFNSKRSLISNYEKQLSDRRISLLQNKNTMLIWVVAVIATLLLVLIFLFVYIYKVNRKLVYTQRLLIKKHQEHSHQLEVQNEIFASIENTQMENTGKERVDTDTASAELSVVQESVTADGQDGELLTKKQADMLLMSIAHVMEDSATICNPDFSLSALAQMVNSNTKYVSWVINKSYGKNFKTYLNEYRIRTASQWLANGDMLGAMTIAGIAERVGYKSPASFHQAFKKIYGMTPAAYVKLTKEKQTDF